MIYWTQHENDKNTSCWKVYERSTIFQWKVYGRGIFSAKNNIYKGKVSDFGAGPLRIKVFFSTHLLRDCVMPAWNNTVAIAQILTFKWLFSFGLTVVADKVPCCFNCLD